MCTICATAHQHCSHGTVHSSSIYQRIVLYYHIFASTVHVPSRTRQWWIPIRQQLNSITIYVQLFSKIDSLIENEQVFFVYDSKLFEFLTWIQLKKNFSKSNNKNFELTECVNDERKMNENECNKKWAQQKLKQKKKKEKEINIL